MPLIALMLAIAVLVATTGCSVIPAYTMRNVTAHDASGDKPVQRVIAASRDLSGVNLRGGVFIGISISGGGSRAANFGLAALQELSALGILENAAAISSVSGGSLAAAYFSRYRPNDEKAWSTGKQILGANLFSAWTWRLLQPHNLALMAFTDFDRSDLMAEVFDAQVFGHATFGDLSPELPRLLINATAVDTQSFVFTEDVFEGLGSRLAPYRLADAVMASGAFPGVFNNVTVAAFKAPGPGVPQAQPVGYRHLFDGGPSDNLGIESLKELFDNAVASAFADTKPLPRCMFILVDADASDGPGDHPSWNDRDTRGLLGRVLDTNAFTSIDALFAHRRAGQLREIRPDSGYPFPGLAVWHHTFLVDVAGGTSLKIPCFVWHVSFARLRALATARQGAVPGGFRDRTWCIATGAETHYKLTGRGYSPAAIQTALYDAARILMREDTEAVAAVCEQLQGSVDPQKCRPLPPKRNDGPPVPPVGSCDARRPSGR